MTDFIKDLVNLNTAWELATEYPESFDEEDLFIIIKAHLGSKLANNLREKGSTERPCYEFLSCKECAYFKFCLVQQEPLTVRSRKECQQNLEKYVSSFHSQPT